MPNNTPLSALTAQSLASMHSAAVSVSERVEYPDGDVTRDDHKVTQ